jgi:hypothetical protein
MSNRWTDAAMSLYIFDDQHDKGKNAEETQDNFRGQLLHLMSLLHCFACLVRPPSAHLPPSLCWRLTPRKRLRSI